ncbi:MAG: hypothetical protein DME22_15015 [Verrucomicrobia bacterium]|nr:MAG: hypothetical protein DME22_15015 [Verrucomicrobiota bacterium]
MSGPLSHPTAAAVKAIHQEVLRAHGGSPGLRDESLLESAVAAPQATMLGQPLFTDPIEVAAAYLSVLFFSVKTVCSLMKNSRPMPGKRL